MTAPIFVKSKFVQPLYKVQRLSSCQSSLFLHMSIMTIFKPCDWSMQFMKVLLLVISLVRIDYLDPIFDFILALLYPTILSNI